MPSDIDLVAAVEAAWTAAFGPVGSRGSVSFVGTPPVDVLRFGPDERGRLRYATVGMARMPMIDAAAAIVDPATAPRAELVLTLSERRDSVLRTMAALACAPAVDGLILAPDSTVDTGQPLWDGAGFTAVLLEPPVLPDVTSHPIEPCAGNATDRITDPVAGHLLDHLTDPVVGHATDRIADPVAGHLLDHLTDRLDGESQPVWLLPIVPITATELAYRRIHGAAALRAAWQEAGTDLVSPWRSAAR